MDIVPDYSAREYISNTRENVGYYISGYDVATASNRSVSISTDANRGNTRRDIRWVTPDPIVDKTIIKTIKVKFYYRSSGINRTEKVTLYDIVMATDLTNQVVERSRAGDVETIVGDSRKCERCKA